MLQLYTQSDCVHSKNLLDIMNRHNVDFQHHNVSRSTAPEFISGTPTLVSGQHGYCGDAAFEYVKELLKTQPEPVAEKFQAPASTAVPFSAWKEDNLAAPQEKHPYADMSLDQIMTKMGKPK